jgi:hypothetical protein
MGIKIEMTPTCILLVLMALLLGVNSNLVEIVNGKEYEGQYTAIQSGVYRLSQSRLLTILTERKAMLSQFSTASLTAIS